MRHHRFDKPHSPPRPLFLDPPVEQHRPTLVGLAALAAMWAASALAMGVWLGAVAAVAWRIFNWLT